MPVYNYTVGDTANNSVDLRKLSSEIQEVFGFAMDNIEVLGTATLTNTPIIINHNDSLDLDILNNIIASHQGIQKQSEISVLYTVDGYALNPATTSREFRIIPDMELILTPRTKLLEVTFAGSFLLKSKNEWVVSLFIDETERPKTRNKLKLKSNASGLLAALNLELDSNVNIKDIVQVNPGQSYHISIRWAVMTGTANAIADERSLIVREVR